MIDEEVSLVVDEHENQDKCGYREKTVAKKDGSLYDRVLVVLLREYAKLR